MKKERTYRGYITQAIAQLRGNLLFHCQKKKRTTCRKFPVSVFFYLIIQIDKEKKHLTCSSLVVVWRTEREREKVKNGGPRERKKKKTLDMQFSLVDVWREKKEKKYLTR